MQTYNIRDIQNAYRKLKSYFYHDNFSFSIRDAIADFESVGNIETKFKKIQKIINSTTPKNTKEFRSLLNRISVKVLPKSYESKTKPQDNSFVISNKAATLEYNLSRINYLIDAPVELHIISTMWIIYEGCKLQTQYDRYNYGYKVSLDEDQDKVIEGLRLFEKYFEQYQSWRDQSINTAKNLLENKQDVIIVQMDIKEYFHNVSLSFDQIRDSIEKNELRFTDLLEPIHIKYSEELKKSGYDLQIADRTVPLPIGLLSSGVLGNWYLRNYDKKIIDELSPSFYGRYVDDIIIVLANTQLNYDKVDISSFDEFVSKYFIKRNLLKLGNREDEVDYLVLLPAEDVSQDTLSIQKSKFSILEFSHDQSLAALNNFVNKLKENSSIFWQLPDFEKDTQDFDKSSNDLIYDDSINKLRSLNQILPSKFGASIFLAKRILSSLLSDEKADDSTDKQILSFFKGKFVLELHLLWEKVITYFLINDKKDEFWKFYKACISEITKLKSEKVSGNVVNKVKSYLRAHLNTSMALAGALNPAFFLHVKGVTYQRLSRSKFFEVDSFTKLIKAYRDSNLFRHNYVSLPLINFTQYASHDNSPFYKPLLIKDEVRFLHGLEKEDLKIDFEKFKYCPRYVHLYETNLLSFYQCLVDLNSDENYNRELTEYLLEESFENFYRLNYYYKSDETDDLKNYIKSNLFSYQREEQIGVISLNSAKVPMKEVRIGVANHKVMSSEIKPSIKNQLKFTNAKRDNLIRILNHSTEENADVLVLPEISVPFKWLTTISNEARRKNRVIIAGIEHFSINKICYNFIVTVLPISFNGYNESLIIPRLKNHYSPEEKLLIKNLRYKIPSRKNYFYHLFKWNGVNFTTFNCYELADVRHRSLFRSKVDIIFASEYNKDWKYFSNVAESISRDIHCFYVQSNTSDIGDSRIIQPTKSITKDILRFKGGEKSAVFVGKVRIDLLKEFQELEYEGQKELATFKPTPPDFER